MKTFFLIFFLAFFQNFASADDLYSEVHRRINAIRKSNGLVVLKNNEQLRQAAQSQSDWMARVDRMDHLRPRPSSFEEFKVCNHHPVNRVVNSGYYSFDDLFDTVYSQGGVVFNPKPAADNVDEIIAMGKTPGSNDAYRPDIIVTGWMNSPGHRSVILTPKYREMGIGISSIRQGEVYWCVVFANK
jgi:uncharacterized protein YkwD